MGFIDAQNSVPFCGAFSLVFQLYSFPPEGGNQDGLGVPAKHRGAEDVVGHVHLTSPGGGSSL